MIVTNIDNLRILELYEVLNEYEEGQNLDDYIKERFYTNIPKMIYHLETVTMLIQSNLLAVYLLETRQDKFFNLGVFEIFVKTRKWYDSKNWIHWVHNPNITKNFLIWIMKNSLT